VHLVAEPHHVRGLVQLVASLVEVGNARPLRGSTKPFARGSAPSAGRGVTVFDMASPAAPLPPPSGVPDGVEPPPEWVDDVEAAARFGSPEAIRSALLAEQVGEFDAAFDAALTAARQTLRLDQLRQVLQVWRRVALLTERDPEAYRAMVAAAADIQEAGQPRAGSVSWAELRAELDG
jgi:hypothetical protein